MTNGNELDAWARNQSTKSLVGRCQEYARTMAGVFGHFEQLYPTAFAAYTSNDTIEVVPDSKNHPEAWRPGDFIYWSFMLTENGVRSNHGHVGFFDQDMDIWMATSPGWLDKHIKNGIGYVSFESFKKKAGLTLLGVAHTNGRNSIVMDQGRFAVDPLLGTERQVGAMNANVRPGPAKESGNVIRQLAPGTQHAIVGFDAFGVAPDNDPTNRLWYRVSDGWAHSAGFTEISTNNLVDLNPVIVIPPAIPEPQPVVIDPQIRNLTAADFPTWVKYERVADLHDEKPEVNREAYEYYLMEKGIDHPYFPEEGHLHWWGAATAGLGHDGVVSGFQTADRSVNAVLSAFRITDMVSLSNIAFTTGLRNPWGWKIEVDPTLTDDVYLTMGVYVYVMEKLNPRLRNQALRHHSEFTATSCSGIDLARVRRIVRQFETGELDFETGMPAVTDPPVVEPTPDPEPTEPTPTPEPSTDPDPVTSPETTTPIDKEKIMSTLNSIPTVSVEAGALGSVIESPLTRRRVYSVWVIIGLVIIALTAALIAGAAAALLAIEQKWPTAAVVGIAVLAGISAAYGALSPQMAMLARANTQTSIPVVLPTREDELV